MFVSPIETTLIRDWVEPIYIAAIAPLILGMQFVIGLICFYALKNKSCLLRINDVEKVEEHVDHQLDQFENFQNVNDINIKSLITKVNVELELPKDRDNQKQNIIEKKEIKKQVRSTCSSTFSTSFILSSHLTQNKSHFP
jgi:hypothetical protein